MADEQCTPPEERAMAEAVLKHLFVGGKVDGIRFGPIMQLLIADRDSQKVDLPGDCYVNLFSEWTIFNQRPEQFPDEEAELPPQDIESQLQLLCSLRGLHIRSAELGACKPHLILSFEDGRVFFMNGNDPQYESWQAGAAWSQDELWMIVACPGGSVATWAPEHFSDKNTGQDKEKQL